MYNYIMIVRIINQKVKVRNSHGIRFVTGREKRDRDYFSYSILDTCSCSLTGGGCGERYAQKIKRP